MTARFLRAVNRPEPKRSAGAQQMPCYSPMTAWRSRSGPNPLNGKWPITFHAKDADLKQPISVPCGHCVGCHLERSRQWAIRCVHEAQMHKKNCFVTLTYNEKHLQRINNKLNKDDFTLFMKRLRKKYTKINIWGKINKIKFFHCGEYGSLLQRPHHHVCLFGHDFSDKTLWSVRNNIPLYRSVELEELWSDPLTHESYGYSTIGEVTFESAAYIARYTLKKAANYEHRDESRLQFPKIMPKKFREYITMSRGGREKGSHGIGAEWLKKYESDVYGNDAIILRGGLTCRPPRYYDQLYDKVDSEKLKGFKIERSKKLNPTENTRRRLSEKGINKINQIKNLKRDLCL